MRATPYLGPKKMKVCCHHFNVNRGLSYSVRRFTIPKKNKKCSSLSNLITLYNISTCQKNPLSISFFQDDHINTMAKITFEIDPAQVNPMMQ